MPTMPPQAKTKTKPYLSNSQITSYTRCGEAYRRRYIEREIIAPGIAMMKGTAVHKGAEVNFLQKIETKRDLPVGDITAIAVDTFETQIKQEGVMLSQDEEAEGKGIVIGKAKDRLVITSGLLMGRIAPRYQPETVEEEVTIEIPESTHDLHGIIDLTANGGKIIDLKTSSKTWSQDQADGSGQLTFYAMLHRARFGSDPNGITIENIVDKAKPEVVTLQTSRSMGDYGAMINRVNRVLQGIKAGNFTPAADQAWWCSARFCGYHATCPFVKK